MLRGVHVDHPPAHRAREYLPERLCCLEAMSRRDGHPPRRDLGRSQLADPAVAEYTHRLRKQPAQLLDRLRLATVLGQVHLDQLTQPRRLDQASLAPKPLERPLESLGRSPLRFEPAALDPARTATAEAMPIRPAHRIAVLRLLWEHLSLLRHRHHLRPLVRGDGLRSPGGAALHTTCAQSARRASLSLAKLPPSDDDWCLNLLWLDRGKCLLLTHAGTLFSVFVADVRAAGLRPIAPYAVGAIEAELRSEVLPERFQNCSLSGCLWWSALGGSADAPLLRLSRVLGCSAVACPKPEQRVRQRHRVARAPTSARRAQLDLEPGPARSAPR